jgi:hypothetical protein
MRRSNQLEQKLQREPQPQSSTSWRTAPIEAVNPQDIINTARFEAGKIWTRENQPYRTEAERRGEPLASKRFKLSMWALEGFLAGGTLLTTATLLVTGLMVKSELAGGAIVGSPRLAVAALASGGFSVLMLMVSYFSSKGLKDTFDDRITKALSSAKAVPLAPDKIEWTARFIANIDRMNPCIFRSHRTSIIGRGSQYEIAYWKDVAREAANYAHDKCSSYSDTRYEEVQATAKDIQFDQMLSREVAGKQYQMTEFLDALKTRWFINFERIQGVSDTVAGLCLIASLTAAPTIAHHGAFVIGPYFEWLTKAFGL